MLCAVASLDVCGDLCLPSFLSLSCGFFKDPDLGLQGKGRFPPYKYTIFDDMPISYLPLFLLQFIHLFHSDILNATMSSSRVETSRGELRIHESLDDLSTDLVEYISQLSEASVKERGVFTIALSGGSLIGLLGKLCEAPYIKTIDWTKWYIFWVDERVVAKSHADSNYKLAKDGLLTKVPVIPSHVQSINDSLSAEEAASEYEFGIRQLVKTRVISVSGISDCPKFDLILLGMGPDGHVASLFPDHSALDVTDEWVTFITNSPKPPPERITFTMPVINSASTVAMVVTGGSKAEAVHLAIDDVDVGPNPASLPARMVLPTNGKLLWFLDKEAASRLNGVEFSE